MRPSWEKTWFTVAEAMEARAKCTRRQVGAVLVKGDKLVEAGYNGTPPKRLECGAGGCPRGEYTHDQIPKDADYNQFPCKAIHAEANCLIRAGRKAKGCYLYVTQPPCQQCQNLILGAGVEYVIWPEGSWNTEYDWEEWVL